MKVRLTIDQIAVLLRARIAMSVKASLDLKKYIAQYSPGEERMFSPEQAVVISKLQNTAARIIANRFVKNDSSVSLLTTEDVKAFMPGGSEYIVTGSLDKEELFEDHVKFAVFVSVTVLSFQGEESYANVRKWIQVVLKLSRNQEIEEHEFVRLPDAHDQIVRATLSKQEYLAMQKSLADDGIKLITGPRLQEVGAEQIAKHTNRPIETVRSEMAQRMPEVRQGLREYFQLVMQHANQEADRIFAFSGEELN